MTTMNTQKFNWTTLFIIIGIIAGAVAAIVIINHTIMVQQQYEQLGLQLTEMPPLITELTN
jgi:hypothetical protein